MGIFKELKGMLKESYCEAFEETKKIANVVVKSTSEVINKENIEKFKEELSEIKSIVSDEKFKNKLMNLAEKKITKEKEKITKENVVKAGKIAMEKMKSTGEEILEEENKMIDYSYEQLIRERNRGNLAHRMAAGKILREKYNLSNEKNWNKK